MKHSTHISATALACALLAGSPFWVAPAEAQPSSRAAAAPLRVTGFDVEQVDRLEPGAELNFTVWGTAGANVLLQIDGSRRTVRLDETSPGRYQGSYIVSRSDRIGPESRVHANLRRDNRVATVLLGESLQVGWPVPGQAAMPEIQSASVVREPGRRSDALRFTVRGTPGGQASVQLTGSQPRNIVLEEMRPGEYGSTYVLPQGAWVDTDQPLVAQLRIGDRSVRSSVPNAYANVSFTQPRRAADAACYDCATVQAVNAVTVDGDGRVLGTVAGGVLGAVVGSQVGSGSGRTAAQVAGAVGGALLGREIQKRHNERTQYEVVVRMNDGQQRTVIYADPPNFRVGDRVRMVGETLELQRR